MAAGVAVWQPKGSSREATPLEFQIKDIVWAAGRAPVPRWYGWTPYGLITSKPQGPPKRVVPARHRADPNPLGGVRMGRMETARTASGASDVGR